MENYVLGILGIIVSIILFFIGYRQTVGARKERTVSANSEVEKILVRRIVLESFTPTLADITRLLEGKARDFRVRVGDLYSEGQVLNCIFTRIIETDLIAQSQREEILGRITPILADAEAAPVSEESILDLPSYRQRLLYRMAIPMALGVSASVMGSLLVFIPDLRQAQEFSKDELATVIATMIASLTMIAVMYTFYRVRESQEETAKNSKSKSIEMYVDFERNVARLLQDVGASIFPAEPTDRGYDFVAKIGNKRVLIEVKAWTRRMPLPLVEKIAQVLSAQVKRSGADEGIIVLKAPIDIPKDWREIDNVKILTLREFRNYLSHTVS